VRIVNTLAVWTICILVATTAFAESVKPMQGFPPTKDSQVTLMNWASPPYNRWGLRNAGIVPSVMVPREGAIYTIPDGKKVALGKVEFRFNGNKHTVIDALKDDYSDGIVVIKDGNLIFEDYFGEFGPHDHHIWASSTKSLVGLAAGVLVEQGKLDLKQQVTDYIPELKGSAFEPLTVQQVLNMVSALDYSENYADLEPGTVHYEYFRRVGLTPAFDLMMLDPKNDDTPRGVYSFLPRFKGRADLKPGEVFEYHSPNVDVIAWIIARQSGMPLQQFIQENIWGKLQTEHDAFFMTDIDFTPFASGGFNTTLRDYARLGLAVLNNGKLNGVQVLPEQWVRDIPKVNDALIEYTNQSVYKDTKAVSFDPQLIAYKNFWWVHDRDKGIFTARGVYGQTLYIDRSKNLVIACFGSAQTASNAARETSKVKMAAFEAIANAL